MLIPQLDRDHGMLPDHQYGRLFMLHQSVQLITELLLLTH